MLTIYVIYHITMEDTCIFTTDKNKIYSLILQQIKKYENTENEWKWREFEEENEFDADFTTF